MTPNPYTVAGVDADDMDKLQCNVALADKKFIDSLVPDRGFKTWAVSLFLMAIVDDIKKEGIDSYDLDNEQSIRQIVRDRTALRPARQISLRHDSRGSPRVRKTSKANKKVTARS